MNNLKTICAPLSVIEGALITQAKRQELYGVIAGGKGSMAPENYQRQMIITGTGYDCIKTGMRLNLATHVLKEVSFPNKKADGFDYSENFDGLQIVGSKKFYINLKCIVGTGGSQTRSLREVYWFVKGQLNNLLHTEDIYYVNILDGDEAHKTMDKFMYAASSRTYADVKNRLYVGDLKGYFAWFKTIVDAQQ